MFTGLIEDVGTVESLDSNGDGARLRIATSLGGEISAGDSVAVNGVCLTAIDAGGDGFGAEAMNQTLRITSLGPLQPGDRVNLELALRAGDRFGGHFVQGHVDGTAEVTEVDRDGFSRRARLRLDRGLARQVVEHGAIALDGVSLTVSALGADWVEVALIPETLGRTNLGDTAPGRLMNVECDLVGKYVQRLLTPLEGDEGTEGDD